MSEAQAGWPGGTSHSNAEGIAGVRGTPHLPSAYARHSLLSKAELLLYGLVDSWGVHTRYHILLISLSYYLSAGYLEYLRLVDSAVLIDWSIAIRYVSYLDAPEAFVLQSIDVPSQLEAASQTGATAGRKASQAARVKHEAQERKKPRLKQSLMKGQWKEEKKEKEEESNGSYNAEEEDRDDMWEEVRRCSKGKQGKLGHIARVYSNTLNRDGRSPPNSNTHQRPKPANLCQSTLIGWATDKGETSDYPHSTNNERYD
ncbi:hypothetical protein K439DRAFT_1621564 [Ramaria rubella]|nr:hypothetical protein K439DRAFT_1621564 [Ramaria rubella]